MSVEIITFKKLGFFSRLLGLFFLLKCSFRRAMLQLELGESKPEESQSEQSKTETRKAASCSSETLKSNACRQRTGRARLPRLEPRQSLEKSSIGWPPQPRAWQSEVPSCKLRLCSPISFGFSPCECVKRNPSLPPSSCGELKWVKMLDLRALCRRNLVFSIDGDHVHLHGSASISYFENFVGRWFSDHPLR